MLEIPTKPYPTQDLISVDDHIIEAAHVWTSRAPAKLKDAAPRVVIDQDGLEKWKVEDLPLRSNGGLSALAGRSYEEFTSKAYNFKDMRPGCYDPAERVKDMDLDGVRIQMCFPAVPGLGGESFMRIKDPELRHWAISAYNDYILEEFQAANPDRLIGYGILPMTETEAALAELERIGKLGMKSISVPFWMHEQVPGAKPLIDQCYDRIWSLCEELDMPVNFHIGGGMRHIGIDSLTSGIPGMAEAFITSARLVNFDMLSQIIWTGMLDRHPKLQVVSTEGGIGWVPHFLQWADHVFERHRHWTRSPLEVQPSDYFHRQCYAAFLDDPAGVDLRHVIGVENLLWESDYPHSDTTWPFSHQSIEESMAVVPHDERRKIVWENAARLYKLNQREPVAA